MNGFTTSDTTEHVWPAFCDALGAALNVLKTQKANAGSFEYTYPTLSDVLAAVREVLARHDCVLTQIPSGNPDGATWRLTTMILHPKGEWIEFDPYTRPIVKDEQGFGGALTYGRRYSLTSIFAIGVADDDGADVTEQQRNVQKYDGSRTPEELAIRTMMSAFPTNPLFPEMFKSQFGHKLSDLAVQHHGTALRWVTSFFADPPDPPSEGSASSDGEAAEAPQEVPPTTEAPAASKRKTTTPTQETP